ncbi:zinc-dependent peptidase [Hydrogenophaga sp.]|uniref:M90 family metallopeptidase n=1 Tax=Hydrogenophaga sp. TaxID=1904254 RepID=UPI0025B94651|nr:zinc-dependent peptidase [Hydrogenophaga sp.]
MSSAFTIRLPPFAQAWLPRRWRSPTPIPLPLWRKTLAQHRFLQSLSASEQARLRQLCTHFLAEKEFHGAHEFVITDTIALAIAAQACLPLLHLGGVRRSPDGDALRALDWYEDFVGIVVQPGAAVAQREVTDGAGVVHRYREVLAGEAMDRGPIMLSWEAVAQADGGAEAGHNVVIHEFVHKMDMRGIELGQHPAGAPPLPPGFLGTHTESEARTRWQAVMKPSFDAFCEAVSMAERFGGEAPWLDPYAATHPAEFFAVTCEAYFVNRQRFDIEFPALMPLYDGFFRPGR